MDQSLNTYEGTKEGRVDLFKATVNGTFDRGDIDLQMFLQQQSYGGGAVGHTSQWLDGKLPKRSDAALPSDSRVSREFSRAMEAEQLPASLATACKGHVKSVIDWFQLPAKEVFLPRLQATLLEEVASDIGVPNPALQSLGRGEFDESQLEETGFTRDGFMNTIEAGCYNAIKKAPVWATTLGQVSTPEEEAKRLAKEFLTVKNGSHAATSQRSILGHSHTSAARQTTCSNFGGTGRRLGELYSSSHRSASQR